MPARLVAGRAVVGHDQRPGGERHQFPGEQERVGVGGEDDEVHAGDEGGEERQHPVRRMLVPSVADGEQAGAGGAEIDQDEEHGAQAVDAEMRAEPGQADRQHQRPVAAGEGGQERQQADHAGGAVDQGGGPRRARAERRRYRQEQQGRDAAEHDRNRHRRPPRKGAGRLGSWFRPAAIWRPSVMSVWPVRDRVCRRFRCGSLAYPIRFLNAHTAGRPGESGNALCGGQRG